MTPQSWTAAVEAATNNNCGTMSKKNTQNDEEKTK